MQEQQVDIPMEFVFQQLCKNIVAKKKKRNLFISILPHGNTDETDICGILAGQ